MTVLDSSARPSAAVRGNGGDRRPRSRLVAVVRGYFSRVARSFSVSASASRRFLSAPDALPASASSCEASVVSCSDVAAALRSFDRICSARSIVWTALRARSGWIALVRVS